MCSPKELSRSSPTSRKMVSQNVRLATKSSVRLASVDRMSGQRGSHCTMVSGLKGSRVARLLVKAVTDNFARVAGAKSGQEQVMDRIDAMKVFVTAVEEEIWRAPPVG